MQASFTASGTLDEIKNTIAGQVKSARVENKGADAVLANLGERIVAHAKECVGEDADATAAVHASISITATLTSERKSPDNKEEKDLASLPKDELVALAKKRGITVTRGDGEDGEPLKEDYVAALAEK